MIAHTSTGRDVAIVCLFIFGAVAIVFGALKCGERSNASPAAMPTGIPSAGRP